VRPDDFAPDSTATDAHRPNTSGDAENVRGLLGTRPVTSRAIVATLQIGESRVIAALLELRAKRTPFGWTTVRT
jgi:hypothetical protein